jgi:hypothetical protein
MRLPFLLAAAAVATAALFSEAPTAHAQSAGSYPFCAVYANKGGTPMCYFTSREQCMADISGVGGLCIENSSLSPDRSSGLVASPTYGQTFASAGRRDAKILICTLHKMPQCGSRASSRPTPFKNTEG